MNFYCALEEASHDRPCILAIFADSHLLRKQLDQWASNNREGQIHHWVFKIVEGALVETSGGRCFNHNVDKLFLSSLTDNVEQWRVFSVAIKVEYPTIRSLELHVEEALSSIHDAILTTLLQSVPRLETLKIKLHPHQSGHSQMAPTHLQKSIAEVGLLHNLHTLVLDARKNEYANGLQMSPEVVGKTANFISYASAQALITTIQDAKRLRDLTLDRVHVFLADEPSLSEHLEKAVADKTTLERVSFLPGFQRSCFVVESTGGPKNTSPIMKSDDEIRRVFFSSSNSAALKSAAILNMFMKRRGVGTLDAVVGPPEGFIFGKSTGSKKRKHTLPNNANFYNLAWIGVFDDLSACKAPTASYYRLLQLLGPSSFLPHSLLKSTK